MRSNIGVQDAFSPPPALQERNGLGISAGQQEVEHVLVMKVKLTDWASDSGAQSLVT